MTENEKIVALNRFAEKNFIGTALFKPFVETSDIQEKLCLIEIAAAAASNDRLLDWVERARRTL